MINVVFNDSTNGLMKEAKNSNFENIVNIPFCLDMGDINLSIIGNERKAFFHEMFQEPDDQEDAFDSIERYWKKCVDNFNRLMEGVKNNETIRIWYSDEPYAMCGFYFVMSQIYRYNCNVLAIKLPDIYEELDGNIRQYRSWGEVEPQQFCKFLPFEVNVSSIKQKIYAKEWELLKKDYSYLRAVVNGRLQGVPENFYDSFILKSIPDNEFTMGRLIGHVLGEYNLGISDWFVAQRILKMIEEHTLKIVKKGDITYTNILSKCNP